MIHENKIRSLILIIIYVGTNRRKNTTTLNFLNHFCFKLSEMNSWLYHHPDYFPYMNQTEMK